MELDGERKRTQQLTRLTAGMRRVTRTDEWTDAEQREYLQALLDALIDDAGLDTANSSAESSGDWGAREHEDLSGQTLGPYQLVELIDRGGMGAVYRAIQAAPFERDVAIKVILPGVGGRQVLRRFDAERQTLARLSHPNIATVLDAGAADDGRPYFVMEFVHGKSLAAYCDEHRLSIEDRLKLFVAVCRGVAHAHQNAILHRDLKPTNILVTEVDGVPQPKIIDFGIAKALSDAADPATNLTKPDQIVGTPDYMSPEQANPELGPVDTRSDVYSLGVILYELLTGAPPFELPERHRLAFIQRALREAEPPTPSTRVQRLLHRNRDALTAAANQRGVDPRRLVKRLRGELDWIVMMCLERDRERRYDSVRDLGDDVDRCLRREPVKARGPSHWYRLSNFVGRHRVAVGLATAAVVLAAGLGGWATRAELQRLQTATQLAQSAASRAQSEADAAEARASLVAEGQRASALESMLEDVIVAARPGVARGLDTQLLELVLSRLDERILTDASLRPEAVARVRETLARAYLAVGDFERATDRLKTAYDYAREALGPAHVRTLGVANEYAKALFALDRVDDAERVWSDTLERAEVNMGPDSLAAGIALGGLGAIRRVEGRVAEAIELLRGSVRIVESHEDADAHMALAARDNLGQALMAIGALAEAADVLDDVVQAKRAALGADHPSTLISKAALAETYRRLGRYDAALPLYESVVEEQAYVFGPQHRETLVTTGNLAVLYINLERWEDAAPLARQVYESKRDTLGEHHRETLTSLSALGAVQVEMGAAEAARETFSAVVAGARRLAPPYPRLLGVALGGLGRAQLDLGDVQAAEQTMLESYQILEVYAGANHQFTRKAASTLTRVYEALDDAYEAEYWRDLATP